MNRIASWGWHRTLAALALAAALAAGAGLAWAETTTAPAVSPQNHTASVDAFKKAFDLYQQEKFADANAENDKALKLDPSNSDAQTLHRILAKNIAGSATEPASATHPAAMEKIKLLKPSDVSLIRIHELSPEDKNLKGSVDRKTLDSFWNDVIRKSGATLTQADQAKFMSTENFAGQLQQIKDHGDVAYMEKVVFTGDPVLLLKFKQNIQPFVLQNCATSQCHGGDKAGAFRLVSNAATNDQTVYTNFYILSMYSFGGGKMIDREQPDKSLLLQFLLPKSIANFNHPKVDIKARFQDSTAPEFQNVVTWIQGDIKKNIPGLAFPRPNYGVIYELPTEAPATAPAPPPTTAPATAPKPPTTRPAGKTGG